MDSFYASSKLSTSNDSKLNSNKWQKLFSIHNGKHGTSKQILRESLIAFGLILCIGVPRLLGLNSFVTADENLWLKYSGWFYYALSNHDFSTTFQVSHPGVTVMWAGLAGFAREYPSYKNQIEGQDRPVGLNALAMDDFTIPLRILVTGRRAIIVLHILILGLSYWFARRLFGTIPALMGFLVVAFDPFDIALSKILQPDGLLAHLILLSLLSFMDYLNTQRITTLIISAMASGLAWLTKSPGLFLIPLMTLLVLLNQVQIKSNRDKSLWWKSFLQIARTMTVWGLVGTLVVFLLWPAMWVDPIGSLIKVFSGAIGYAEQGHDSAVFFNGSIHANGNISDLSFYPINFLWRTTPVILLGLIAAIILFIRRWVVSYQNQNDKISLLNHKTSPENQTKEESILQGNDSKIWVEMTLFFCALGFAAFMALGLKKFDRYIIPSIVLLDLLAGVNLFWMTQWVVQLFREKSRAVLTGAILLSFVAVQAALALSVSPYYFNYYNPLLGGSKQALKVMQIGWGEGLDQAANYINNKPNSDKLRVIAWYGYGSFSYFSKSQVSPLDLDHPWSEADWNKFNKSDYAVIYIHEWQRNLPAEVLDRLRGLKPEYSVWFNGLEYVRVYKLR